ncbi:MULTISPECIES: DegV family protein [unclassified Clostridium]|uniref:DegV family protein n=1 Tax=Clostridium TaxID=1485 RepID=UPI001C8B454C|nr:MULTISPECIES: DegV family protein [unclassified Clostridium]MBX9138733.1 DegV family protein [Clostridium sp. K12(2020)]MBX9145486.1 DegV family protein [Clostridium sp. K13]MDU2291476.1 DegV family protein [Clostridium celatum]MDU4324685.1 DegV family protein [Clostridium celatum]
MSVKIIADSTCYLPQEYIDKYKVAIVSLNVLLNGNSYRETDLSNNWFYNEMAKSATIPTSSQPSIEDLYNAVETEIKAGNDVVGIFLSSDMSGTFSTSNLVKNMILENYPDANIKMIDSRSNCMQAGFAVLEAAKAAYENKSLDEVVSIAKNVIENSKFIFVPDTLEYLKKGGRIGGAAALFGSLLQIRPILTVEDGKTTVFTKVRTKKKAIDKIVNTILEQNSKSPIKGLIVHHINCESEGQELANRLKSSLGLDNVKIQSIGPIIGLHVGPGSIGVAYHY